MKFAAWKATYHWNKRTNYKWSQISKKIPLLKISEHSKKILQKRISFYLLIYSYICYNIYGRCSNICLPKLLIYSWRCFHELSFSQPPHLIWTNPINKLGPHILFLYYILIYTYIQTSNYVQIKFTNKWDMYWFVHLFNNIVTAIPRTTGREKLVLVKAHIKMKEKKLLIYNQQYQQHVQCDTTSKI